MNRRTFLAACGLAAVVPGDVGKRLSRTWVTEWMPLGKPTGFMKRVTWRPGSRYPMTTYYKDIRLDAGKKT